MSHTTEQARELWCPLIRVEMQRTTGCSAVSDPRHQRVNCIGSQCAMWRWSPEKTKREFRIVPNDIGGGNEVYVDVPTHGYCGLAGRPEVMP